MRKIIYLVFTLVFLISCNKKPVSREEMLLGHWKVIPAKDSLSSKIFDIRGYEFLDNDSCEYKLGYYGEYDQDKYIIPYHGSYTHYKIFHDSLHIFNPASKKWDNYKIEFLSYDTLHLTGKWFLKSESLKFVKQKYKLKSIVDFDALISSRTPCFGPCPTNDIYIDSRGAVEFFYTSGGPNDSLFLSKISNPDFINIKNKFKRASYNTLSEYYYYDMTDASAVSVSFIKNNRISKSIYDYANAAPAEFIWAYYNLNSLPHQLEALKKKVPDYYNFTYVKFIKDNKGLELTRSEIFFLLKQLSAGKSVLKKFKEIYTLETNDDYVKIKTNGRYYKFYYHNSTTKIIDIGYNFLEENKFAFKFEKL